MVNKAITLAVCTTILILSVCAWYVYVLTESGSREYTIERNVLRSVGDSYLRYMQTENGASRPWLEALRQLQQVVQTGTDGDAISQWDRLVFLPEASPAEGKPPDIGDQMLVFARPKPLIAHGINAFIVTRDGGGYVVNITPAQDNAGGSSRSISEFLRIANDMWDCGKRKDIGGLGRLQAELNGVKEYVGYDDRGTKRRFNAQQLEALATQVRNWVISGGARRRDSIESSAEQMCWKACGDRALTVVWLSHAEPRRWTSALSERYLSFWCNVP